MEQVDKKKADVKNRGQDTLIKTNEGSLSFLSNLLFNLILTDQMLNFVEKFDQNYFPFYFLSNYLLSPD